MKLNIQPQAIQYGTVSNLLNGSINSLAGPVGFTPEQERIVVKRIQVTNPNTTGSVQFTIYKGASAANSSGSQVFAGTAAAMSTIGIETDLVLDAADFLTGTCVSNGTVVVNIGAETA